MPLITRSNEYLHTPPLQVPSAAIEKRGQGKNSILSTNRFLFFFGAMAGQMFFKRHLLQKVRRVYVRPRRLSAAFRWANKSIETAAGHLSVEIPNTIEPFPGYSKRAR